MAASKQSTDPNRNIPEYEYDDVNTKPFHIGSFRDEWLSRLRPRDYSYLQEDEDTFDAAFAAEMGVGAETMAELKSICRGTLMEKHLSAGCREVGLLCDFDRTEHLALMCYPNWSAVEVTQFQSRVERHFLHSLHLDPLGSSAYVCTTHWKFNVDSLRCHAEDEQLDVDIVPPDSTLKTLIQRKRKQDRRAPLKSSKNRHDLYADELERLTVGRTSETQTNMVPEGEILLTINVYYPAVYEKFSYTRPHMTLLMTGSHSLAELRDAICCVSDLQVCGEFSMTPNMAPDFICKDHYKSAFFFFESIFYNDMRFPECQDISITTVEWAKSHNFPPYSQAKMEDTLLADLKVKVGFPYLYCHQGDCEHLVIITDVRLTHKNDCLDKKLYPLLTHKHRVVTQKCAVCHIFIGRWYTTNDQFAPSDPCLFCDKCFRMLHYDAEGNKLGEFLAYPYVDRGAFN